MTRLPGWTGKRYQRAWPGCVDRAGGGAVARAVERRWAARASRRRCRAAAVYSSGQLRRRAERRLARRRSGGSTTARAAPFWQRDRERRAAGEGRDLERDALRPDRCGTRCSGALVRLAEENGRGVGRRARAAATRRRRSCGRPGTATWRAVSPKSCQPSGSGLPTRPSAGRVFQVDGLLVPGVVRQEDGVVLGVAVEGEAGAAREVEARVDDRGADRQRREVEAQQADRGAACRSRSWTRRRRRP